MRSVGHDTFGAPDQVLTQREVETPVAGPGQVLVRTILSPIHNHDLVTVTGNYGVKPALPAVGGTEAVGVVEAVGEGADEALVGRRVAVAGSPGTWAEYFVAPAGALVPVPDAMTDEAAAQLISMPFSAISLVEFLGVQEGDWIVQTAANGAVGKIVAVLARSRGLKVVNLVRREAAIAELAELGIDNVIATESADWVAQARALVGEAGARAAVDSVGGDVANGLAELLGDDGLLVTFGAASNQPLVISSGPIIFKQLTVKGFWGAKVSRATSAEDRTRMFGELIGLVLDGSLSLTSGGTFGLDQPSDAVVASQSPGRSGKIMFRP
ncbi:NADPH:quinone reductase-like Zn-dependent oxidoreductase [Nocardioides sp. BE266]|uniref:zinc-binding dehydrogenase n=1 Tax=Nocardioides sp. BE266 TaxID=2817725 RepID=UPI002857065B|nr:zinc-binding dehydrogenase [Nocardioides sp. BE266]MDR7254811.1 NADPH:quinone reductase-like Zn-dependent oxidoreductase [Nocardioides sp. BE266]